jgi:hypothetical protein
MNQLLALFASDLAEVRFGDLDGAILEAGAEAVDAAAAALADAEQVAASARTALDQAQEALMHKALRALAHARIHAEGNPELAQRLALIALDRTGSPRALDPTAAGSGFAAAPVRRRGRPPNGASEVTGTLRLDESAAAADAGAGQSAISDISDASLAAAQM